MSTTVYIAILALAAAVTFNRGYSPSVAIPVIAVSALLLALPWYLNNRDHSQPASPAERRIAVGWAWVRRIVCFGAGAVCFALSGTPLVIGLMGESYLKAFLWVGGFLAAGIALVGLGIFGYPGRYYGDNDGARVARLANKERYRRRL